MRYFQTFIRILRDVQPRPTKYFILIVISIIGLFSLAYMHNYNIVYLMMFFVFSLAGASSIIGRLNLYELEASLLSTHRLFAHTESSYTLMISNPNPHRTSFALECSNSYTTENIDELAGLQKHTLTLSYIPNHRGKHSLPPLQINSLFPLPHEVLYKTLKIPNEVIVYPEPKGDSLQGAHSKHKAFFGEQEDFEGIKLYQEGDPLSRIYWPSLAKGEEIMSKEFNQLEKSRHLHFYFEKAGDDTESRLCQLCLWAKECQQKGIEYTLHLPNLSLDSRRRSYDEILSILALY